MKKDSIGCFFVFVAIIAVPIILWVAVDNCCETRIIRKETNNVEFVRKVLEKGYIKNNNDFDIRIKCVWIFKGETTVFIKKLKPKARIDMHISFQHGFHIYDMKGIEIGWVAFGP